MELFAQLLVGRMELFVELFVELLVGRVEVFVEQREEKRREIEREGARQRQNKFGRKIR